MLKARPERCGVVLLEALVALALIATAALSVLALTASDSQHIARLIGRSKEISTASEFMEVVSIWTRTDLDQRLGSRPQGPYLLRILRPTPSVYTLELFDGETGRPLLSTATYRPEGSVESQR
jgi:hypothetical protein